MLDSLVAAHRVAGLSWPHWSEKENPGAAERWKIIETRRTLHVHEQMIGQRIARNQVGEENIKRGWGSDYVARPYGSHPSDWSGSPHDAYNEAAEMALGIDKFVSAPR